MDLMNLNFFQESMNLLQNVDDLELIALHSYYIGVVITYALFFPKRIFSYDYLSLCFFYLGTYYTIYQCKIMKILEIPLRIVGLYICYDFYLIVRHLLLIARKMGYQTLHSKNA